MIHSRYPYPLDADFYACEAYGTLKASPGLRTPYRPAKLSNQKNHPYSFIPTPSDCFVVQDDASDPHFSNLTPSSWSFHYIQPSTLHKLPPGDPLANLLDVRTSTYAGTSRVAGGLVNRPFETFRGHGLRPDSRPVATVCLSDCRHNFNPSS
ncbi:hypothetical protein Hypma_009391 [Hypsizygus marmoreus]|uniref:Uncharacterized protein n=1 Tax=Hypsizygus marmoreus TaxID=39966 RepID=A0A369JNF9_HYPMA|nr:hypothetical protein Hypma_009391 [Hypsizygus marmoreus]